MQTNRYDPGAIDDDTFNVACRGPEVSAPGTKNVFQYPEPVYSGSVAPVLVGHDVSVAFGACGVTQLPNTAGFEPCGVSGRGEFERSAAMPNEIVCGAPVPRLLKVIESPGRTLMVLGKKAAKL
jgi:hypothetical protein